MSRSVHIAAIAVALSAVCAGSAVATQPAGDLAAAVLQGQGGGKGQKPEEARGRGGQGPQRAERERGGGKGQEKARQGQGREQGRERPAQLQRREERAAERPARGREKQDRPAQERPQRDAAPGRGRGVGGAGEAREDRGPAGPPADAPGRSRAARGQGPARLAPERVQAYVAELPSPVRRMARSPRASERMVVGALARARARGVPASALGVRTGNGTVQVLSPRDELLLELDEARARDLGAWEMRRLGDRRPRGNAPAFCRSGQGHPVWGREWCLDRGFGLGSAAGSIWSRGRVEDVVYRRRTDRDRLDRGGLIEVLGDVVFGRLALHALTLGLTDPLVGTWVAEPDGPRLLRVRSGGVEVAELVDLDRDDRVEVLYVVQPRW